MAGPRFVGHHAAVRQRGAAPAFLAEDGFHYSRGHYRFWARPSSFRRPGRSWGGSPGVPPCFPTWASGTFRCRIVGAIPTFAVPWGVDLHRGMWHLLRVVTSSMDRVARPPAGRDLLHPHGGPQRPVRAVALCRGDPPPFRGNPLRSGRSGSIRACPGAGPPGAAPGPTPNAGRRCGGGRIGDPRFHVPARHRPRRHLPGKAVRPTASP